MSGVENEVGCWYLFVIFIEVEVDGMWVDFKDEYFDKVRFVGV